MLKTLTQEIAPTTEELNNGPSAITIQLLLQYSKVVIAKKVNNKAVLLNLN